MKTPATDISLAANTRSRNGQRLARAADRIKPTFKRGGARIHVERSVPIDDKHWATMSPERKFASRHPNYRCAVYPSVTEDVAGRTRVSFKPWGRGSIKRSQAKRRALARQSGKH